MTQLLDELERALTDLLQSGLDTGGPAACARLRTLAVRCEDAGLHTGAALARELETALEARPHALEKDNLTPAACICRLARYLELCREKAQEDAIVRRWQARGQDSQDTQKPGGNL